MNVVLLVISIVAAILGIIIRVLTKDTDYEKDGKLDKDHIGRIEDINDDMFLLCNSVAKMTEVPITVSSWGLYGKAYKENADNYFKED